MECALIDKRSDAASGKHFPGGTPKTHLKLSEGQTSLSAISNPISISFAELLSPEEISQLLETVEMLKKLVEANPDDDQSLEILKEAYWKIGDQAQGLAVTRQLADTYMKLGQYSAAMLEYEGILLHEPNSPEVVAILAELEGKLYQNKNTAAHSSIALDFGLVELEETADAPASPEVSAAKEDNAAQPPSLIATPATRLPTSPRNQAPVTLTHDGNDPLARFLVQHRLAAQDAVDSALKCVRDKNASLRANPDTQAISAGLLEEIINAGADADPLLARILDLTKFAYAPLEYYDIDRQIVKILPDNITLGRRILPFDIVSRTMMVAIDNPFDTPAKALVQQAVDYHIQWHLATPGVLRRILRDSYRLAG